MIRIDEAHEKWKAGKLLDARSKKSAKKWKVPLTKNVRGKLYKLTGWSWGSIDRNRDEVKKLRDHYLFNVHTCSQKVPNEGVIYLIYTRPKDKKKKTKKSTESTKSVRPTGKKRWHWMSAAINLIRSPGNGDVGKAREKVGFSSMFYEHPEIYPEDDCKRFVMAYYKAKTIKELPAGFKKEYFF